MSFLSKNGVDPTAVYELSEVPFEFLRDPTYWIEAHQIEEFLRKLEKQYGNMFNGENLIEKVGFVSYELGAWGVLDSVLKMMSSPQDIFHHPQRFISYFVSPAPPLGHLQTTASRVSFEIPISSDDYPYATTFLKAALSGLPKYMQHEPAAVQWKATRMTIDWSSEAEQKSMFVENDRRQMDPAFVRSMLQRLEAVEQELQEKNRLLLEQETIRENLNSAFHSRGESDAALTLQSVQEDLASLHPELREIQGMFIRLIDYQTRAQQLVTLLTAGKRADPNIEKAMHRVDWEFVKNEFNGVVDHGVEHLKHVRAIVQKWSNRTPEKLKVRSPMAREALQFNLFAHKEASHENHEHPSP